MAVCKPGKTQNRRFSIALSIASSTRSGFIGGGPTSMMRGFEVAWCISGVSTVEGHTQQMWTPFPRVSWWSTSVKATTANFEAA